MEKRKRLMGVRVLAIGVILGLLIMSGSGGVSAYGEEPLPCADEIAKYCKEVKPGGGRIIACLKEHESELTALCKGKIEEITTRVKEFERACSDDLGKFCKDVQPGGGRLAKCLKEHETELSAPCTEKIAETKAMLREKRQQKQ